MGVTMEQEQLEQIRDAVDLLVQHEDYPRLRRELNVLAGVDDGWFIGPLGELNALLVYARRRGPDALRSIFDLCDRKYRENRPDDTRRDYQAAYMAQRRQRLNKAVRVEEMRTGVMEPDVRREFRKTAQAMWMVRRDEMLAEMGELDWSTRNDVVREFWEEIDDQLDAALNGDHAAAVFVLGSPGRRR